MLTQLKLTGLSSRHSDSHISQWPWLWDKGKKFLDVEVRTYKLASGRGHGKSEYRQWSGEAYTK